VFVGRLDAQLVEPAATLVFDEVPFPNFDFTYRRVLLCLSANRKTLTRTKQNVENARQAVLPQQRTAVGKNAVSVVPTFARQDV